MVEYSFDLLDRGIRRQNHRMLDLARPISTRLDAEERLKDSCVAMALLSQPGRAFETPDYYVFARVVPDYFRKIEYYKRTRPPGDHPVCDFLTSGYAIRKFDGHVVSYYKRNLVTLYGFQRIED